MYKCVTLDMYIYICIYRIMQILTYIYIYIEREREREKVSGQERQKWLPSKQGIPETMNVKQTTYKMHGHNFQNGKEGVFEKGVPLEINTISTKNMKLNSNALITSRKNCVINSSRCVCVCVCGWGLGGGSSVRHHLEASFGWLRHCQATRP